MPHVTTSLGRDWPNLYQWVSDGWYVVYLHVCRMRITLGDVNNFLYSVTKQDHFKTFKNDLELNTTTAL